MKREWETKIGKVTVVVYLSASIYCQTGIKDSSNNQPAILPQNTPCSCPEEPLEDPFSYPIPLRSIGQVGISGASGNNSIVTPSPAEQVSVVMSGSNTASVK